MTALEALVLGVVQGLTEFLPVSSSGHLVVAEALLGTRTETGGVLFEVVVHAGTLAAVVAGYHSDIWKMIREGLRALPLLLRGRFSEGLADPHARLAVAVVVGTLPTGIIGLALEDLFESLFANLLAVGVAFLVTGTLLFGAGRLAARRTGPARDQAGLRMRDALIVGLAQGAAITPGISRSGTTIATAMLLGLDRVLAARLSFLLSLPAILGAVVLQLRHGVPQLEGGPLPYVVGFLTAAVSGYLALRFLLVLLTRGRFGSFALYLWPLGVGVVAWALLR